MYFFYFFPLGIDRPKQRPPLLSYVLMGVMLVAFLWSRYLEHGTAMGPSDLIFFPGHGSPWTVLTAVFLHVGWFHLLGNMLFLWIFGDNMEDEMGHVGFLLFYLASGIAAGLCQVAADPNSLVPTVGASGAIAGGVGGYLLMFPRARIDILIIIIVIFKIFPVPAWLMLGVWFAIQLFSGATADVSQGGVAYWAHLDGFVAGVILILPA